MTGIVCIFTAGRVKVINELTDYLKEDTETRQGLDIMDDQFVTFGSAKVMIQNIGFAQARELAAALEQVKGVSSVSFYEEDDEDEKEITDAEALKDVYNDASALFLITFETDEDDDEAKKSMANVREVLSDYDTYFYSTVDKDDAKNLKEDMKYILLILVIIIITVLLFTSTTYMEIPIFMMVFGMAALLNVGTNFMFGSISFISNAVGTVLQLALAIDYAIIMFHRFMEERAHYDAEPAMINALEKAIPEISSSSLTTVAGMIALMFMEYGIGPDLGRVLTKAIIFSMLSVFCFMPGLIMNFTEQIDKSMHRSFVPTINHWGNLVVATRYVILPVFLVVMIAAIFFSSHCTYNFDKNSVESKRMDEYLTSKREISKSFEMDNAMAVLVPTGDYASEAAILARVKELDRVESTLGLANVTVDDDEMYVLTDRLSPREFSYVADMDVDTCRMLYRFYAWKEEKYGAFLNGIDEFNVPLIDMIDFIYGEDKNESFDFADDLSQDIKDMHKKVSDARLQLEGEEYDRLIFTVSGPVEGEDTFKLVDKVRDIAYEYYNDVYVIGDSTADYDLSKSFLKDNMIISIMTAAFVLIILFFTFDNKIMPIVLVMSIQSAIWINFSIPALEKKDMFFLSYLVVCAIQMGATIDYAIVITSRYVELRQTVADKKQCIKDTLNQSLPTIITSGAILTLAAWVVGNMTSNCVIASLGTTLSAGTLISIVIVMLILPQLLYVFDGVFQKSYWRNKRTFVNDK
ncbi:MAG: MMPL family transporter [Lachnospiraceae bacterium]|nr:MMPL family transporter [Lachnospiraceae bacterium]